jgi:shikimate kinase/3-dehydroquinate synthase
MKGNIYLTGFMASGKSTVDRILADALNRSFIDMDVMLEKDFGKSISEVFAHDGEQVFRDKESRLLESLSKQERLVVATGGGVPERTENRNTMQHSWTTIYLDSEPDSCAGRLTSDEKATRPLWQDKKSLHKLFDRRKEFYLTADLQVMVDGNSPEGVAEEILVNLYPAQRFSATLGIADCPVIVTYKGPDALHELVENKRVFLITDQNVARLHKERYSEALADSSRFLLEPGEHAKSLNSARAIYEELIRHRFDRDDILVAMGGGVVTDLGAFVASTFKRGMSFVLISTTLLGCVDAAIGGKAAVNLSEQKNVVGTFSIPRGVILDLAALRTLSGEHINEGLIEAYKTGLIASHSLTELIEKNTSCLMSGDQLLLAQVANMSARNKAEVVAKDFREKGTRMILNFGHTFGHAMESYHSFEVSHGTCVAVGMNIATEISRSRQLISDEISNSILSTLRHISPIDVSLPTAIQAWDIMQHDKKIRKGRIIFVLLEGIGKAVCVDDVTKNELDAAILATKEKLDE